MYIYPFLKSHQKLHGIKSKIINPMEDRTRTETDNIQLSQRKWPVALKRCSSICKQGNANRTIKGFSLAKGKRLMLFSAAMGVGNGLPPGATRVVIGLTFQESDLSVFVHTYNANTLWQGAFIPRYMTYRNTLMYKKDSCTGICIATGLDWKIRNDPNIPK